MRAEDAESIRMINNMKSLFIVYLPLKPIPTLALPLKRREFTAPPSRGRLRGGWVLISG
jgi:hypothetical protein